MIFSEGGTAKIFPFILTFKPFKNTFADRHRIFTLERYLSKNTYNLYYKYLASEGQRPLGRPGHRWEYNNKTDLRENEWGEGCVD
jgi:hypothetical protein